MKLLIVLLFSCGSVVAQNIDQVLVFSKTEGFRHKSIEVGVKTLTALGTEHGFAITHTENSEVFNSENLLRYKLVIFLNTTGNVLNEKQQDAFKAFINNGGSFLGVHSATDTEYDWPWYGKLVGAYFISHPEQSQANLKIVNTNHEATQHLDANWKHFDEWYNFKNISDAINPLIMLDETSYAGGENGDYHPIAWCQEFDGGRSFYTGLGHTIEAYSDPNFRMHLLGGIRYCLD
ncbi:cytochrome c551/c552 [Formosa agariphila KMM 3901]|uniref:Cytochrome c551/c552 n=1 Tax=Formosa agariphila (strain DSM 15362 / KCTC 12365 / LMG 23005 / KMM 3901 / M-2Alg 35-1) TaxID=1347342 RepID=T2KRI4_FORAG|nr:ThuA domain-containing protein [Formosa agariphila]CDF81133.1 cytochrome c551/c552 [Formosa agariphila KMM 3901]